jgi:hypothetical protein
VQLPLMLASEFTFDIVYIPQQNLLVWI